MGSAILSFSHSLRRIRDLGIRAAIMGHLLRQIRLKWPGFREARMVLNDRFEDIVIGT